MLVSLGIAVRLCFFFFFPVYPLAGTFRVSSKGQSTGSLPVDVSAEVLQAAVSAALQASRKRRAPLPQGAGAQDESDGSVDSATSVAAVWMAALSDRPQRQRVPTHFAAADPSPPPYPAHCASHLRNPTVGTDSLLTYCSAAVVCSGGRIAR